MRRHDSLRRLAAATAAGLALALPARAADPPSVLYVGPDPDREPDVPFHATDHARTAELIRERMGAFRTLLEAHFDDVRTVAVERWTVEMSREADVTVFDAIPPDGMPADFDRPAVMVGEVAPIALGRQGWKLDHL